MNPEKPQTTLTAKGLIKVGINYARSLTRNLQDAEDLAQHAWFKITKKYGKTENRALYFTAIRNLHCDQVRRTRIVQFSPLETAPETGQTESFGTNHDMQVALSMLSENERSSIFLSVVEGYTASEISKRLGLPRGTVLSHLSRGRKKLRDIFSKEFGVEKTAVA